MASPQTGTAIAPTDPSPPTSAMESAEATVGKVSSYSQSAQEIRSLDLGAGATDSAGGSSNSTGQSAAGIYSAGDAEGDADSDTDGPDASAPADEVSGTSTSGDADNDDDASTDFGSNAYA